MNRFVPVAAWAALAMAAMLPGAAHKSDLASSPAAPERPSWPLMREFTISVGLNLLSDRLYLNIPLFDDNGAVRYRFVCRAGSDEYRAEIERIVHVSSYTADLLCILNPGGREGDRSLLADDESQGAHSRGYFTPGSMVGVCAAYPEYGLVRHFRLRGFELALSLTELVMNPRFDAGSNPNDSSDESRPVQYAVITISLRREPTALTAKADQPGFLDPKDDPQACRVVRRGNEPRMCRNSETSAWEQCPAGWEYRRYPWETQ